MSLGNTPELSACLLLRQWIDEQIYIIQLLYVSMDLVNQKQNLENLISHEKIQIRIS